MSIIKSRNDIRVNRETGTTVESVLTNDLSRNNGAFISSGSLAQNVLSTEKLDLNTYPTTVDKLNKLFFGTEIDTVNSVKKVVLLGKMTTVAETDFINIFYSNDDTTYIMAHATRGTLNPIDGKRHFVIELTDFTRYIKVGNVNSNTISNIDINFVFLKYFVICVFL